MSSPVREVHFCRYDEEKDVKKTEKLSQKCELVSLLLFQTESVSHYFDLISDYFGKVLNI